MNSPQSLTDEIYEAALVPDLWPQVLQRVSALSNSAGGVLLAVNPQNVRWVASPLLASFAQEYFGDGWAKNDKRPERAIRLGLRGFSGDHEFLSPAEMDADPTYQFLRSRGYGWAAGMLTPVPSGDTIIFSFERHFTTGPYDEQNLALLNSLSADLSRAALVAGRLGLEKARSAAETMEALGLPAAVLSHSFHILAANRLFEPFISTLVLDARDGVKLRDVRADALFNKALWNLNAEYDAQVVVQSVPVAAAGGRKPMVVHVVPIRKSAKDIFSAGSSLIVITEVAPQAGPDAHILQGLFDLTPAEARVASALVAGSQVNEIGKLLRVSEATIRTQLKSVYAKTGTGRQAELVSLLSGLASPV
jgi:DNA-binding CsgD family transcriptional regulator